MKRVACVAAMLAIVACRDRSDTRFADRSAFVQRNAPARSGRSGADARTPRSPWELVATIRLESRSSGALHAAAAMDLLSDGSVVVADGNALHLYDPTGRSIRELGPGGGGAKGHSAVAWVGAMQGDTLVTFDRANETVEMRTLAGTTVARHRVSHPEAARLLPATISTDGTIVFGRARLPRVARAVHGGVAQDSGAVLLASAHRDVAQHVGAFPIVEYAIDGAGTASVPTAFPFNATLSASSCNDGVFVAWSADSIVTFAGWDGVVYDSIALPLPALPLPPRLWRMALETKRTTMGRVDTNTTVARMVPPASLPRFDGLVADGCDRLWVRPYTAAFDSSTVWIAYDRAGRMVDREELSDAAEIVRFRGRRVLVRARNADGSYEARVYERQRRN